MSTIDINTLGANLDRGANRDPRGLVAICKTAIVADVKENFVRSADPDGKAWRPLLFQRPRGGSLPLRDTGVLMASVTAAGKGHVERVTNVSVTVGTNLEYAAIHQAGGVVYPKKTFLAIPKTREAQRAGSPRRFPRVLFAKVGKQGGVLVEAKSGTVQYALARQVTIPARPFLGFGRRLLDKLKQLVEGWLAEPVEK